MTNGEMIQKVFKGCEVCEPIPEEDIIHVIFPDKNDSAIGFDWSWWIMEYKEPTTKNDLGVDAVSRAEVLKLMQDNWHTHNGDWAMQESMDDIRALPPVTPQEPKTGRWITWKEAGNEIPSERRFECSVCHDAAQTLCNGLDLLSAYCPNCGCRMIEPQESEAEDGECK